MNEHEAARVAAAMNQLRPDWPVKSLRTLLDRPELASRPRRDVTVALAWIACESNTATPARVLEAGPWWRAAGVEGASSNRDNPAPHQRCSTCSLSEPRCRQLWGHEHEFVPDFRPPTPGSGEHVAHLRTVHHETTAELCGHGVPRANCLDHRKDPA